MRAYTLALLSLTACATSQPAVRPSASPLAKAAAEEAPTLCFLEDDLPKAVALAQERKVPLFVDAWASW